MNNPFRYRPSEEMIAAANELISAVKSSEILDKAFRDGKMLGVLLCRQQDSNGSGFHNAQLSATLPAYSQSDDSQSRSTQSDDAESRDTRSSDNHASKCLSNKKIALYAYSGKRLSDEGTLNFPDGQGAFVPPIYDITQGHFREEEVEISHINARIEHLEQCIKDNEGTHITRDCNSQREHSYGIQDDDFTHITHNCNSNGISNADCKENDETAEIDNRKIYKKYNGKDDESLKNYNPYSSIIKEIERLKAERAEKSVELQRWTFSQYKVANGHGETKDIGTIFAESGLTPPAATGDCAAPKLLQYSYSHNLEPLEIGEFWYGKSPEGPVREQGRFYPACSWKCGPLLRYMTTGLDLKDDAESHTRKPLTVYEDKHIIVADKPSSMPSVPGLDGRKSLLEIIQEHYPERTVFEVHRLDQDTSGLIIYAFSRKDQSALRKQFESREVSKRYIAVLDGIPKVLSDNDCSNSKATATDTDLAAVNAGVIPHDKNSETIGVISLPLAPDYEDKPRQKVSFQQGKEAVTEYRFIGESSSVNDCTTNCYTIVEFTPHTGRTHQLRVHAAHFKGLGCPIAGDTLYGSGSAAARLCLHASYLSFIHPENGRKLEFHSTPDFI